jgi:fructose-1,6-bisphosphatase/inositol monophosphatase family enzyme
MAQSELSGALEVAIAAAREAGAMIRADFHLPGGARGRWAHADVDDEAEAVIRRRLLDAFPEWGYRGEETGSARVDPPPKYLWLVDPNDGTVGFLQGVRGSAVSIALLRFSGSSSPPWRPTTTAISWPGPRGADPSCAMACQFNTNRGQMPWAHMTWYSSQRTPTTCPR